MKALCLSGAGVLLSRLLSVTPAPPGPGADPAEVVALASIVAEARGRVLAEVQVHSTGKVCLDPPGLALMNALLERDLLWRATLEAARDELLRRGWGRRRVVRRTR